MVNDPSTARTEVPDVGDCGPSELFPQPTIIPALMRTAGRQLRIWLIVTRRSEPWWLRIGAGRRASE